MFSRVWDDYPEQLSALESGVAEGLDWPTVSRRVNRCLGPQRSPNACRHKARSMGLEVASGVSLADKDVLLEKSRRKAEYYRSQYNEVVGLLADQQNLVDSMRDVLAVVEPEPIWIPPDMPKDQEEEEAIALVSDMQLGTKSLGDELNLTQRRVWGNLGEFNIDVLRYRIRIWLKAVKKIVKLHRASVPVRKCNLWLLGDILENEFIWKGQGSYIETGLMQQFFVAMYEVAQAIALLAGDFEEVEIHAVAGNHGRGTERKNASKTWTSWEWLWYRYLELVLREVSNVRFDLTPSWFDLPTVQGHTFLMVHGEDVRRYMRFPWYSTERMEKSFSELLSAVGRPFDYMVMGHHHVAASFQTSKGEWFCNGNWVGPTMYSMKTLWEMVKPTQWMMFCHPKRGLTSRWIIDLWQENEAIWRDVKETSYNVHVPFSNQEILSAVHTAQRAVVV